MNKLLQVDFDFQGPFGEEMSALLKELAESINQEPGGMIWKIWTENAQTQQGGGDLFVRRRANSLGVSRYAYCSLAENGHY